MQVRLLKEGYKKDEKLYSAFIDGSVTNNDDFFSDEIIEIEVAPDFPIYMAKGSEEEKKVDYMAAFETISKTYIKLDRDIHFNENFWHSLLVSEKRDYLLEKYPQIKESYNEFCKIVIKDFDWENYIYKCILAVEYIGDSVELYYEKETYYDLIIENLDLFNYIIKYAIFRNGQFMLKILTVIKQLEVSEILKAKIKDRADLGKDERYGRRVIFELNKSYPVLMSPILDVEDLKAEFIKALSLYYDISLLNPKVQTV